jgi:hypothetical protein
MMFAIVRSNFGFAEDCADNSEQAGRRQKAERRKRRDKVM